MKCTYCEKDIPENSKFCMECGKAINLYITLKPNETEPKSITAFQSFNTGKPDVEIVGFDVISRTQSGIEKYNSPKM